MSYTVGEVATFAGITVRALHHYDEVGLLSPSDRSPAGYRLYDDTDVERLQQILLYRELGFSLDDIATILDDPAVDARHHLARQRELLTERVDRLNKMIEAVDAVLEADTMELNLTPEERFELFGDFHPEDYAEEAEQRWGDTDAWKQSAARTKKYTKEDWTRLKEESSAIEQGLAAVMAAGHAAGSEAAMDLAEQHRQHMVRWFYDCPYAMHRGLGEMYVADERFTAYYERVAPGLAQYVRDAIVANADRAEAS